MTNTPSSPTQEGERAALERHCDLMRQGFMRGNPVPALSEAEVAAAREKGAAIVARLDAIESGEWRTQHLGGENVTE